MRHDGIPSVEDEQKAFFGDVPYVDYSKMATHNKPMSGSEKGNGSRGKALSKGPNNLKSKAIEIVVVCTHTGIPCPGPKLKSHADSKVTSKAKTDTPWHQEMQ